MGHEHKLEIFRGLVKFNSNIQKIWGVFAFLCVVTAVEVVLGIIKPEVLVHGRFLTMKYLNWIFIKDKPKLIVFLLYESFDN